MPPHAQEHVVELDVDRRKGQEPRGQRLRPRAPPPRQSRHLARKPRRPRRRVKRPRRVFADDAAEQGQREGRDGPPAEQHGDGAGRQGRGGAPGPGHRVGDAEGREHGARQHRRGQQLAPHPVALPAPRGPAGPAAQLPVVRPGDVPGEPGGGAVQADQRGLHRAPRVRVEEAAGGQREDADGHRGDLRAGAEQRAEERAVFRRAEDVVGEVLPPGLVAAVVEVEEERVLEGLLAVSAALAARRRADCARDAPAAPAPGEGPPAAAAANAAAPSPLTASDPGVAAHVGPQHPHQDRRQERRQQQHRHAAVGDGEPVHLEVLRQKGVPAVAVHPPRERDVGRRPGHGVGEVGPHGREGLGGEHDGLGGVRPGRDGDDAVAVVGRVEVQVREEPHRLSVAVPSRCPPLLLLLLRLDDLAQEAVDGELVHDELEVVVLEDGPAQQVGLVGGQRRGAESRRAVRRDVDGEAERVGARDEAVPVDDLAQAAAPFAGELVGLAKGELVVLVGLAAKFGEVFFFFFFFPGEGGGKARV